MGIDQTLVARATAVRNAVDAAKEEYTGAKRELKVKTEQYDALMAEAKEKFGITSLEDLEAQIQALAVTLDTDLTQLEEMLAAAERVEA